VRFRYQEPLPETVAAFLVDLPRPRAGLFTVHLPNQVDIEELAIPSIMSTDQGRGAGNPSRLSPKRPPYG